METNTIISSSSDIALSIGKYFLYVFSVYWKDIALFTAELILKVALSWIASFSLAVLVSIFIWRSLRKRGVLDALWTHYKFVRRIWLPLIVLLFAYGVSTAFAWRTSGMVIKRAIVERGIVPRAAVSLYCAYQIQHKKIDPEQVRTPDDIIRVLEQGEELYEVTSADFGAKAEQTLREEFTADGSLSIAERSILSIIPFDNLVDGLHDLLIEENPHLMFMMLAALAADTELGRKHMESESFEAFMALGLSRLIQKIEAQCASTVDSLIAPHVWGSLLIALCPFLLILVFRTVVRLTPRKNNMDAHKEMHLTN